MRTPLVTKLAFAATLAAALMAAAPSACSSGPIGLSGDLGFGTSRFEGSNAGSSVTSWGLGLGLPLLGPASWIELRSTGTGNPFEHAVDATTPGARAVNTLTTGFQFAPPLPFTPFLSAGAGVGRSESAAGGAVLGPTANTRVATHERTAAAYSLALGYRFANGFGPTQFEVAFRTHGLVDRQMSSSDFVRVVTFGLHF